MSKRPALTATPHRFFKYFCHAATLIVFASAPVFAEPLPPEEAVTYTGMLGEQAIVFEVTGFKEGPLLGRYSHMRDGVDIPLHAFAPTGMRSCWPRKRPARLRFA